MAEYLAPGVYVEEAVTGSAPIEGVSTSTTGMIGVTERGPVDYPILVTSYGEYTHWFGGTLNIVDFSNAIGAHCYLPHAVQGFFTNGGQLLYVTRIIDSLAVQASTILFDRNTASTRLLRAAGARIGTIAAPPALYLLDTTVIPQGLPPAWFRVGDGSSADFMQLDNQNTVTKQTYVPLNFTLSRSHKVGQKAELISLTPDVGGVARFTADFTISPTDPIASPPGPTARGAVTIVLSGAPTDVTTLVNATDPTLLEIGASGQGEYRFALKATSSPNGTVTVQLDSGLVMSYAVGATVTPLKFQTLLPAPNTPNSGTLGLNASAGDAVIFLSDQDTQFTGRTNLVVFQSDDAINREVRRIGVLSQLAQTTGEYAEYPVGSAVVAVTPNDDNVKVAGVAPAAGDTTLIVNDVNGLSNLMKLVVGPPSSSETITVQNIAPDNAHPPQGTITFTPPLANGTHTVGSSVTRQGGGPPSRVIVGATPAVGATVMTIDDVSGLAAGMNVVVGGTGLVESVTIQGVTPDPTPSLSPQGTITFTPPLTNGLHVVGSSLAPAGAIMKAASTPGDTMIVLNTRLGLSLGDLLRIDVGSQTEYLTVKALPAPGGAPPDAGKVVLSAPLGLPHSMGTAVRRQFAPRQGTLTPSVTFMTANPGDTTLYVTDGTGYKTNAVIQLTTPTGQVYYHRLAQDSSVLLNVGQIYTLKPLVRDHAASSAVVQVNPLLDIQALDVGAWGNRLQVAVQDEPAGLVSGTTLATIISPTQIQLASAAGVESGTVLEFTDPTNGDAVVGDPVKVDLLNRTNMTISLAPAFALSPDQITAAYKAMAAGQQLGVRSREFSITVWWLRQPDPAIPSRNTTVLDSEVFHNLSMDPRHSRYVQTIIGEINGPLRLSDGRPDGQSWYIRVHDKAQDLTQPTKNHKLWSVRLGPETLVDTLPTGQQQPARQTLGDPTFAVGSDSIESIKDATYIGDDADDPKDRTGLFTLMNVEDISLIACPGRTGVDIQGALIDQCESMRYRFAVLDGPRPPDDAIADVIAQRQQFDTKYAALYYPWLTIDDPYPKNLNNVSPFAIPPSGHVLGIYARVDEAVGVHKAPANEVINGITGLQRTLYKPQQDILNPYPVNVNVIRDFRHYDRGLVVYGARVITSDSDWIYVNVRRLLIFIEASLDQGLQWAVFEPNAEPLWARIRRSITNFLTIVWRNGALQGSKPEQAFFVKCDQTTMTQTDQDNGRVISIIGLAPVKPAEYVILRVALWAAPPGS
jgi:phage tail sheath protein FI